jgi:hypothetical protein
MADRTTAGQDFGKWMFNALLNILGSRDDEPSITDDHSAFTENSATGKVAGPLHPNNINDSVQ